MSDRPGAGASVARSIIAPVAVAYVGVATVLVALGLLITNAPALAGVRAWDEDVSAWLVDQRSAWLDTAVSWAGRTADTVPVVVAASVVTLVLVARRRYADTLVLAVGLALELSVFLTVNYLVQRPRPDVEKLGGQPGTYSFPSGHVAASVVLWGAVAYLLSRTHHGALTVVAWVVATIVALVVAFSRVYRGMHHLTDVVAGATLGAVALGVGIVVSQRAGERAVRSRPPAEPHADTSLVDDPMEVTA